ncbi:hypothetical protein BS78_07G025100 [Paspalum vaginatum]|nr:hypothetical protein BS78_07G025100 [Paspalum vaginatum]
MDACSAGTRTILIHDVPERAVCVHDAVPPQEVLAIDERMAKTTARPESDFSMVETKIHRFPAALRGIGGDDGRYISPSVVAIGPYHRGELRLQKMEEVKLAAAYCLCRNSGSTLEVYKKVLSVVGAARGCYDADDVSVKGLSDADFAAMMFLYACFPLQASIQKDIFLLENQIPWLVLDIVTQFMPVDLRQFVDDMGAKFLPGGMEQAKKSCPRWQTLCGCSKAPTTPTAGTIRGGGGGTEQYKPPHLLGLLWFTLMGNMPADMATYKGFPRSLSSCAVELAEIGVMLTPSKEAWFGDMRVERCSLYGELLLSPLFLSKVTACWLVNLAALEASTSGARKHSKE